MRPWLPDEADIGSARHRSPERLLWCAVIWRALEDALGRAGGGTDIRGRDRVIAEARDWFAENGADFRVACDAAGLDPDAVRAFALRVIVPERVPA